MLGSAAGVRVHLQGSLQEKGHQRRLQTDPGRGRRHWIWGPIADRPVARRSRNERRTPLEQQLELAPHDDLPLFADSEPARGSSFRIVVLQTMMAETRPV